MIQVIQRALAVLEHLAWHGENPVALGDIARATGLNSATCARILGTLMLEGYVEQEGRRQGYRLGPMAYTLTCRGPYRKDLVACAEPHVRDLARITGETAIVTILHQNTRYIICRAEGGQDVQVPQGSRRLDNRSQPSEASGTAPGIEDLVEQHHHGF